MRQDPERMIELLEEFADDLGIDPAVEAFWRDLVERERLARETEVDERADLVGR